jgi:hypothetical protein
MLSHTQTAGLLAIINSLGACAYLKCGLVSKGLAHKLVLVIFYIYPTRVDQRSQMIFLEHTPYNAHIIYTTQLAIVAHNKVTARTRISFNGMYLLCFQ